MASEPEPVAWACKTCNSPRSIDPCPKCGTPLTKPADGWEWPGLPDINRIRELAREVGYAVGVHGSQERDFDLIAAPWVAEAVGPLELAQHIAAGLGGRVVDYERQDKPCGRWSCNIHTPDWTKLIDLSVMPPLESALLAAEQRGRESERAALGNVEVEWVVNDIAELGVKIGNQFFFLYKGGSLTYTAEEGDSTPLHEDGSPMHWRPVFKREFGECCHPINYSDLTLIGTVSLSDSEDWKELPAAKEVGSPLRLSELVAAIRKGE